ncbi:ComF family protein [Geomonas sp. RF6]|uniref:ComF family protein n=1 Tax=Geomonas sp. RF6 TaxID=2897342 RepID=UPI001E2EAD4B|nr:ComF family protein [Geomonas sp. RF6]UFS72393.1 ComF family protein [Geomonas sp. RF6]
MPFRALLDILFPPLCHLCKAFIQHAGDLHICADCLGKISFITERFCPVCGIPFTSPLDDSHLCGPCLLHAPPFDSCRSATLYEGPVRDLVHRLKYDGKVHLALPLGLLMVHALEPLRAQVGPELIVPVPLHRRRLRQRGYNQSQLIAEEVGKRWKVPVSVGNLRRVRWTEPQTSLPAAERKVNVRGAFEVRYAERLEGKRVLLVDDVLTTGSTVRACAAALKGARAASVCVATVARGVPS